MFKTKVQELCQRRSWNLPEYATSREGPDHNPRFSSTVTVNGVSFSSPSPTRTAKQAQNDAAMLAFHHFSPPSPSPSPLSSSLPSPLSSSLPSPSLPPPFPQDSLSICGLPSFPQPSLCASPPVNVELPQKGACYIASGSPGPNTDVDDILPTAGVLQPVLEKVCQTSQISSPVTTVIDPMTAGDHKNMSHLYKSQLQRYAQKRNLSLPVYSPEWEGPPHAMRFKCKVTFDGQTYESDKFYSSLKAAEHAAAEVALMSLSPSGVQEDHSGLYKSLLQELIQKEGFCLPIYSTSKSGEAHMPIFVSQVEVEGEPFTGKEAKSKKQAEINAAKVAYMALKECKGKSDKKSLVPVSSHQGQACEFSTYCSEANVVTGLQPHTNPKSPVSPGLVNQNQPDKDKNSMALKKFDEDVLKRVLMRKRSVSKDVTTHTEIDSSAEEDQMKGIVPCKRNCSNPSEGAKDVEQGPSTKLCKEKMTFDSKSAPFLEFVGVGDEIRTLWDAHFQTGPVIQDPLTSDEDRKKLEEIGKSDQISSCSFTTHKGQAPGFSSEHSNVVAGLQHNGNPNSLVVCPGLVTWDQHNKDKLKIGSSSAGNMNGCTEDSCLSNGNIELVSDTSNTPSPALGTPSHRKKVGVYSRKTNVEIEDGGTLMPISDDMWVAYTFPLK